MKLLLGIFMLFTAHSLWAATLDEIRQVIRERGPEQFISELASRTAATLPRMVDNTHEAFGATAIKRTIVYYVRHTKEEKEYFTNSQWLSNEMLKERANSICTAPAAKILIYEFGSAYRYMVYSKSREYVFQYEFNRETCEKYARGK